MDVFSIFAQDCEGEASQKCSHICRAMSTADFLDPECRSQKATLVVVVVVVVVVIISSLKIPKAFLIRSRAQQNFAYTFVLTFPADLPSQIFYFL